MSGETYESGRPCGKGHPGVRFVSDRKCVQCRRENDRLRYLRRRQQKREYDRRYYAENRQGFIERAAKWAQKNPGKRKDIVDRYYRNNQVECHARVVANMKSRRQATPGWLTKQHREEIVEHYRLSKYLAEISGIPHHVDHEVPINGRNVCGLHVPWNLQVIPAAANVRKSNKHG